MITDEHAKRLDCPVCGNRTLDLIPDAFTRPVWDWPEEWPVLKCRTCGLLCTYAQSEIPLLDT